MQTTSVKIFFLFLFLGCFFCQASYAQQESALLHTWKHENYWNPAAVGRNSTLNTNAVVQTHAAQYENAGSTMWAAADMPLNFAQLHQGVGASLTNDAIALFRQQQLALQYALHRKLGKGRFSLGVQVLLLQLALEASKADLSNASDPAFPTVDVKGSSFDMGLGMSYDYKALHLSLSVNKLLASEVSLEQNYFFQQQRQYNALLSYQIATHSPYLTIVPFVRWRSDFSEHRFDLATRIHYRFERNGLYGGLNYSPLRSVALFLGGTYQNFDLSYAYEAFTSALGLGAGQHEISLTYRVDLNLTNKKHNKHKSARWL